jgi:hypothetical protein
MMVADIMFHYFHNWGHAVAQLVEAGRSPVQIPDEVDYFQMP